MYGKSSGASTIGLKHFQSIINRKEATEYVFPPPFDPDTFRKRAVLVDTNEVIDEWNDEVQILNSIPLVLFFTTMTHCKELENLMI